MPKTVAIVQSFYLPWKGYFDLMNSADHYVLFDDMQYARRFWINRNKIKTPTGLTWLTIPVKVKGKFQQAIKDTEISESTWRIKHWATLQRCYARAAYFDQYADSFAELYLSSKETYLSQINYRFIQTICQILGIGTQFSWSMDYPLAAGKTWRLVDLCQQLQADIYLTGPTAKSYLEEELFREAGIELRYMDYSGYPEYPQLYPPFVHQVSILDLIFNVGPQAPQYLKSFSAPAGR